MERMKSKMNNCVPLISLAKIVSGGTPSKRNPEYWNGDIPWISAKTMKVDRVSTSDLFISEEGLCAGSKLAPIGSILILTRGSELFNRIPICYVEKEVAFNQDVKCIIPNETIDGEFLYYALLNKKEELLNKVGVTGIGAGKVETEELKKLEVPVYSKTKQLCYVKHIKTYDRKVELNYILIHHYEDLIISIYKKLFNPDRSCYRWEHKKFIDFLTPSTGKIGNTEVPVYSATNNGISLRDKKFNKNLSKSTKNNKRVIKDDLIFGLSREILNFGIFKDEIGSVSPAYQVFKIDTNIILPNILELEIRTNMYKYMDILQLGAREGQGIRKDYLLNKLFDVPPMELQLKFEEIAKPVEQKIAKLKEENEVLTEIRDTLLPKLMSGELLVEVGE